MMPPRLSAWRLLVSVMVDPAGTHRSAAERPSPLRALVALAVSLAALGTATLPRQLAILNRTLIPTGDPILDAPQAALKSGLVRLMVVDRLVPAPTLLIAAVLLVLAVDPLLGLARDRRSAIWAVAVLGLAPLLVERIGELAVSYLIPLSASVVPGDAVGAPDRFTTGPLLFWRRSDPAPAWLEILNARLSLITLWSVTLWTLGLRELDRRRFAWWQLALPAMCLIGGGLLTWALAPVFLSVLLGPP